MSDGDFMELYRQTRADIAAAAIPVGPMLSIPLEAGHYVYVHHDAKGAPLYVGLTKDPLQRIANHVSQRRRRSRWLPLVHEITWERYNSPGEAAGRESALIDELDPPHNVAGKMDRPAQRRVRKPHMRLEVDQYVMSDIARMVGTGFRLNDLCDALESAA